jgi:transcriptional regulator with XRE-family HTH domain
VKKFSELSRKVYSDPARRARVEEHKARLMQAVTLAELRKARALTQVQLAKTLDTTQSGVSRIEHQTDIYLSTLRSFIEAMGGHLELSAIFPDGTVVISTFEEAVSQREDDRSNGDFAPKAADDLPMAR